MTTKVTVNAHAGWPVKVTIIDDVGEGKELRGENEVAPHTEREFYVTQTRKLLIEELSKP